MAYYAVDSVDDRRVDETSGQVQYRVSWKCTSPAVYRTWEPRAALSAFAADAIQAVDQAALEEVEADVLGWRAGRRWLRCRPAPSTSTAGRAAPDGGGAESRKRRRPERDDTVSESVAKALEGPDVEVLSAVVWRSPVDPRRAPAPSGEAAPTEEGVAVLLGEVVLSEAAADALSHAGSSSSAGGCHRRRRPQARAAASATSPNSALCGPALALDRHWHARLSHDLLRSCAATSSMTPLCPRWGGQMPLPLARHPHADRSAVPTAAFQVTPSVLSRARRLEAERGAGGLTIVGIAPVQETHRGRAFAAPFAFSPWMGTEACEDLRTSASTTAPHLTAAATDAVTPHTEQLVVRYRCPRALALSEARPAGSSSLGGHDTVDRAAEVTTAMPLSVFRVAFPQLLIDYLLAHTVVLHGEPNHADDGPLAPT